MENKNEKYLLSLIPLILIAAMAVGIFTLGNPEELMSGDFTIAILAVAIVYSIFVIWSVFTLEGKVLLEDRKSKNRGIIILILLFAFIVRVYISSMITGYPTDMACWTAWSNSAVEGGLFKIYSNVSFLDYPPGYIFVLYVIGNFAKILNIGIGSEAYNLILKAPAIISDVVMGWILYRLCAKKLLPTMGLVIAFLYIFNPLVILDSAAWGQIDSVLTLAIAGYLLFLYKENIIAATLVFVAGLLIKPQMLFFGPVLAVVFIQYVVKNERMKALKVYLISLLSGIALFALVVIPFTQGRPWYWIFEKYMGTINSYNYITLNSANIFGLLGLNWMPTSTVKFGLTLGTWGIIGITATVLLYFVLGFINRDRKNIFILTATLMTGVYAFGLKMHERYIFPVIVILLIAYIFDNKRSILVKFSVLSTAVFINVAQVLAMIHIPPDDIIFKVSSGLITAVYIWMVVFCFKEVVRSHRESKIKGSAKPEEIIDPLLPE